MNDISPRVHPAAIPFLSRPMLMEPTALTDYRRRLMAIAPTADVFALYGDPSPMDAPKPRKPYEMSGGVAIIKLSGPLQKDPDWIMRYLGGTSTRVFITLLNMAMGDPDVSSICIIGDSPGGDVDGTAEAAEAVYTIRQGGKKPIVGAVDNMCCSACYWIMSQCSQLYALQTALVGSIGTRWTLLDTSAEYEMLGWKAIYVTSGTYKAAGCDGTEITDDTIAYYQKLVDDTQSRFTAGVIRGRKISTEGVRAIAAEAKVYVAKPAEDAGLIDGVMSVSDVIRTLQKQAGKPGTTAARSGTGAKMKSAEEIVSGIKALFNGSGGDDTDTTDPTALQARITTLTNEKAGLANQVATLNVQNTTLTSQVQILTTERDALQARVTTFEAAEQSAAAQALTDAKASAIATATTAFGPGTEQLAKAQAYIEAQTNVGAVTSIEAAYKLATPKALNGNGSRQTQTTETRTTDDPQTDAELFAEVRAEAKAANSR